MTARLDLSHWTYRRILDSGVLQHSGKASPFHVTAADILAFERRDPARRACPTCGHVNVSAVAS